MSIIRTNGHPSAHIVLRGGRKKANCDPETIREVLGKMVKLGLTPSLLVDCSHANSNKQALAQPQVWESILQFHMEQEPRVVGAMLESNLETGRQDLIPGHHKTKQKDAVIDQRKSFVAEIAMVNHVIPSR